MRIQNKQKTKSKRELFAYRMHGCILLFFFLASLDFQSKHRCDFTVAVAAAAVMATLNASHSIKMSLFTKHFTLGKHVCVCDCVCVIYTEKIHKDANKVCVQLIGSSQNHLVSFGCGYFLRLMDRLLSMGWNLESIFFLFVCLRCLYRAALCCTAHCVDLCADARACSHN